MLFFLFFMEPLPCLIDFCLFSGKCFVNHARQRIAYCLCVCVHGLVRATLCTTLFWIHTLWFKAYSFCQTLLTANSIHYKCFYTFPAFDGVVFVKTLTGKTLSFDFKKSDTIQTLKAKMKETKGVREVEEIPIEHLILNFKGNVS